MIDFIVLQSIEKRGFPSYGIAPLVLFWYYKLIQSISDLPMLIGVEVAVSAVDHFHGVPDALRDQVRGKT